MKSLKGVYLDRLLEEKKRLLEFKGSLNDSFVKLFTNSWDYSLKIKVIEEENKSKDINVLLDFDSAFSYVFYLTKENLINKNSIRNIIEKELKKINLEKEDSQLIDLERDKVIDTKDVVTNAEKEENAEIDANANVNINLGEAYLYSKSIKKSLKSIVFESRTDPISKITNFQKNEPVFFSKEELKDKKIKIKISTNVVEAKNIKEFKQALYEYAIYIITGKKLKKDQDFFKNSSGLEAKEIEDVFVNFLSGLLSSVEQNMSVEVGFILEEILRLDVQKKSGISGSPLNLSHSKKRSSMALIMACNGFLKEGKGSKIYDALSRGTKPSESDFESDFEKFINIDEQSKKEIEGVIEKNLDGFCKVLGIVNKSDLYYEDIETDAVFKNHVIKPARFDFIVRHKNFNNNKNILLLDLKCSSIHSTSARPIDKGITGANAENNAIKQIYKFIEETNCVVKAVAMTQIIYTINYDVNKGFVFSFPSDKGKSLSTIVSDPVQSVTKSVDNRSFVLDLETSKPLDSDIDNERLVPYEVIDRSSNFPSLKEKIESEIKQTIKKTLETIYENKEKIKDFITADVYVSRKASVVYEIFNKKNREILLLAKRVSKDDNNILGLNDEHFNKFKEDDSFYYNQLYKEFLNLTMKGLTKEKRGRRKDEITRYFIKNITGDLEVNNETLQTELIREINDWLNYIRTDVLEVKINEKLGDLKSSIHNRKLQLHYGYNEESYEDNMDDYGYNEESYEDNMNDYGYNEESYEDNMDDDDYDEESYNSYELKLQILKQLNEKEKNLYEKSRDFSFYRIGLETALLLSTIYIEKSEKVYNPTSISNPYGEDYMKVVNIFSNDFKNNNDLIVNNFLRLEHQSLASEIYDSIDYTKTKYNFQYIMKLFIDSKLK